MSSEWRDGDVAAIEFMRGVERGMWLDGQWIVTGGRASSAHYDVRPLVVIDPEDREQVGRLTDAIYRHGEPEVYVDKLQAALREFANPKPPKPDEPTGLGAVVIAGDGRPWIHHGRGKWMRDDAMVLGWADLDVIRVESEGVIA